LAWSRIIYGIDKLSFAGLPARLVLYRVASMFKDLGMRFSEYNRRETIAGVS